MKRLPRKCPGRSLLPWSPAESTRQPAPEAAAPRRRKSGLRGGTGRLKRWTAIARLSFSPAYPTSRSRAPSAAASSRATSGVVRPDFSTRRYRWPPAPHGS